MTLCPIIGHSNTVVASVNGIPAAVRVTPPDPAGGSGGGGSLLLLASSGVAAKPVVALPLREQHVPLPNAPPQNYEPDEIPLGNPFPMLSHVRSLLEPLLASQTPFDVATRANDTRDLSVIVSRVSAERYIVAVANNGLNELPFNISSRVGSISQMTGEKTAFFSFSSTFNLKVIDLPRQARDNIGKTQKRTTCFFVQRLRCMMRR